jgi:hypothetical protein
MQGVQVETLVPGYATAEATARALGVTAERIRVLCREGRFPGAINQMRIWLIPVSAVEGYQPPKRGRPPFSDRVLP